jgi:hypothetical protein
MLAQQKIFKPVFPSYFSLKELTDLYFDNFAISYVSFEPVEKKEYFGNVIDGSFKEKLEGKIVIKAWKELPVQFKNCILGDYMLSPNGFCGIIMIDNRMSWENSRKFIPRILTSFKNRSTKLLNQFHGKHGRVFWENNYFEGIIENVEDLKQALDNINNS